MREPGESAQFRVLLVSFDSPSLLSFPPHNSNTNNISLLCSLSRRLSNLKTLNSAPSSQPCRPLSLRLWSLALAVLPVVPVVAVLPVVVVRNVVGPPDDAPTPSRKTRKRVKRGLPCQRCLRRLCAQPANAPTGSGQGQAGQRVNCEYPKGHNRCRYCRGGNRTIAQCASISCIYVVPEHLEGRARDLLATNRRLVQGEAGVTIAAVETQARVLDLEMTAHTREVNRATRAARAAPAPVAAGSPSTPISTRLLPAPPNAPLMRSLTASVRDAAAPPVSPPTVTNADIIQALTHLTISVNCELPASH
ncbi:hypothetical protein EDD37DRAFT_608402 [Exophiala viscosa]|uniref:uncharacterized protein n=1 Tax=Exophiala viscosa TaxID=2486360 RepID=UPI0021936B38|nr:hypothetical protein EDD37DRAFT_608402 [Exophiala viscosa]